MVVAVAVRGVDGAPLGTHRCHDAGVTAERLVVDGLGRLPQFAHAGLTDDHVFVAGTLGTDDGLALVEGGTGPETAQALRNVATILGAAGATLEDVVMVRVHLHDLGTFTAMNDAYGAFFDGTPPARITIGGVDLALHANVELECVARRPRPTTPDGRGAALPTRRTGRLDHDGERLHFEVVGEGGIPLVLCHGAGGNHASWFQQVATFAAARTVVTWDHRAYGRSTDRADRSGPEVAVGDLLALLDHLDITRCDLVGQSMGGWTAVGAALVRPGLVRSLVLADTLGGFTSDAVSAALAAPRSVEADALDDGRLGRHPALDAGFANRSPELAHLYQSLGSMGSADPTRIIPRLLAVTHDAAEAATITCPVLCLAGDRDPLFPPAAVRAVADLLPDARVVELPGSGHSPYFEDPEAWNLVVGRFLAQVDRADPARR